jgi:WD40 repeat protein
VADTRADIPSVVERTRRIETAASVVAAHFLGSVAVLVLGEEALLLVRPQGEPQRITLHAGAVLCSTANGKCIFTGGDDGKVMATDARGVSSVIATDAKRRWIDHLAGGPHGALAWSAGKQAFVRTGKARERALEVGSTVGGLAFAPKGTRLAISHYNGVTLWFPNLEAEPEVLAWKGSHLATTVSPDGRFVVTAMQEPTLHGWRLSDRRDMRMSGYGARVRSFDWTAGGKWLATSGSTELILWSFESKDGPMGKMPEQLARAELPVEAVACHPRQEVAAVGYADGRILIVRITDGAEVLARRPAGAAVGALAWSEDGNLLAFGAEDGEAGIVDLA